MKFKIFGTRIYISFLFAAVIAFLLVIDRTGLVIPTILAAIIHEIGHLLAMWACECQPKDIRLIPASIQIVRGFSKGAYSEIAIALCGPCANLVFFGIFLLIFSYSNSQFALTFSALNLILCIYNLLPVSGLDGGTILKEIIAQKTDPYKAERTVKITAFILGILVLAAALVLSYIGKFNITAFIISIYLIITSLIKR